MTEHTPSPQSVVVSVELVQRAINLLPISAPRKELSAAIAAATAPSSLAGGEDWKNDVEWLRECSRYFLKRDTKGEDSSFWSNMKNSKNAARIADRILAALSPEAQTREGGLGVGSRTTIKEYIHTYEVEVIGIDGDTAWIKYLSNGVRTSVLLHYLTPRHEAPTYADDLVNESVRRRDEEFGRREAPAEVAGEMDDDDASTYAPSVAGLSDYLWNQAQAADSVEGRCILEMWREAVDALRARSSAPEAREGEAVAWRWRQRSKGPDAYWSVGHTPVDTGDEGETARIFEVQPLYTHPAAPSADKLRIAVEALERIAAMQGTAGTDLSSLTRTFARKIARQALAAMEAEGAK